MNELNCPKFEDCSAPLCPLEKNSLKNGVWYADEEICRRKDFQGLDWIKRQRAITRLGASPDRYWTIGMLKVIRQVRRGIEGIDPDQPLKQAKEMEEKWTVEKKEGRVIANQIEKERRVIAGQKG